MFASRDCRVIIALLHIKLWFCFELHQFSSCFQSLSSRRSIVKAADILLFCLLFANGFQGSTDWHIKHKTAYGTQIGTLNTNELFAFEPLQHRFTTFIQSCQLEHSDFCVTMVRSSLRWIKKDPTSTSSGSHHDHKRVFTITIKLPQSEVQQPSSATSYQMTTLLSTTNYGQKIANN